MLAFKESPSLTLSIACPQCGRDHCIPKSYVEGAARLLKCANCHHVWRYTLTNLNLFEDPLSFMSPRPSFQERTKGSEMEVYEDHDEVMPQIHYTSQRHFTKTSPLKDERHTSGYSYPFDNFPKIANDAPLKERFSYRLDWWLLLAASSLALFVVAREVGFLPDISHFYEKIYVFAEKSLRDLLPPSLVKIELKDQGIELHVLTTNLIIQGEDAEIKIKAEVTNHSKEVVDIPEIEVQLMDKTEEDTLKMRTSWTHKLEDTPLKPGESRFFETSGKVKGTTQPEKIILSFKDSEK